MEVSREELARRFDAMSDEELQRHVSSRDLTPLAVEVAASILKSRGIERASLPESAPSAAMAAADEGIDLVTVAEARNSIEANSIKLFLESHGLFAAVVGEYLTPGPLAFHYGALPRIQVRNDQVARAREVLVAMRRGELEDTGVFDAEFVNDPSHSERELSDLEATLEIPVPGRPAPPPGVPSLTTRSPQAAARSMTTSPAWPQAAAVNPVASPGKGVLSRLLVLVIGVALTVWLWATLTH